MIRHLKKLEERFHLRAERHAPRLAPYFRKYARVGRFVASGGTAAVVDLGLLYVLIEYFFLQYLLSAALAFVASFFVSFVLQKFWTFEDESVSHVHVQASLSFTIAIINLGLNTVLMYVFVDIVGLGYMLAQIIVGILLAFESFFILKLFIFKKRSQIV